MIPDDDFTAAYVEAALWSSTDDDGRPLDDNYDVTDIAPETLAEMVADCAAFQETNAALLAEAYARSSYNGWGWSPKAQAGHDFWLTRNHHGAGFWDRGLGEVGDKLTDAAQTWGSVDLYVGDEGTVWA